MKSIYLDVLIVLNIYVNYFLLRATAKFTHTPLKTIRCIISSVIGSLFSLTILLPAGNFLIPLAIKLGAAVVIVGMAFGVKDKKHTLKLILTEENTMNIFKKNNEKKTTQKLPMTGKVRKGFRAYCAVIAAATLVCGMSVTAFAASDPITVVNNLSDFIFGLIRAIGLILLGFGIVQVGLSLKSHDPSQRANGFLTLAGGIIITFAKEILTLITG